MIVTQFTHYYNNFIKHRTQSMEPYCNEAERRQDHFLNLFQIKRDPKLGKLCYSAIQEYTDSIFDKESSYLLPDCESMTVEQIFHKFMGSKYAESKDNNVDYKTQFEVISLGNMLIEKQLAKIQDRNSSLLSKWSRLNGKGAGSHGDDYGQYKNESVISSNNEEGLPEDQSLSGLDIPAKAYSKSSKNEGKILPPYAPGDKKKRYRRTANEIERHYKCPAENCKKCYGSEGSLNQHVKLKHPELTQPVGDQKSALAMAIARGVQKEQEAKMQKKEESKSNSKGSDT